LITSRKSQLRTKKRAEPNVTTRHRTVLKINALVKRKGYVPICEEKSIEELRDRREGKGCH